jgi:hypothetical protein
MASGSRQKTTMAKLNRERALRERRELKQAKKMARRREAAAATEPVAHRLPAAEAGEGDEPASRPVAADQSTGGEMPRDADAQPEPAPAAPGKPADADLPGA